MLFDRKNLLSKSRSIFNVYRKARLRGLE